MAAQDDVLRRAQRRIGTVLRGKWTLERLLGYGGMAAVYAGVHRNGTKGAIKVLHPDLALDAGLRARFLREGYVANSIPHPGVVRVLDDDEDEDGTVFLVMELLDGESIDSRATRHARRLPPSEVLSLADQILDVLAAAHEAGVVHRDIKPENLFLTSASEVKLLDFGIAGVREKNRGPNGTQPGSTMGTVVYMAPEQARGRWEEVDARTDLFAVGATMFYLISGRFIHEADTENEQLLAAMSHGAPGLASVAPDAPTSVVDVVDRALAFEKANRWHDARAMQEAVRVAYHGMFGKPITTAPRLAIPSDALGGASNASGRTTGGRVPLGLSRTTVGQYLEQRRVGILALAIGMLGVIAAFALGSRRGGAPAVTATAAPTVQTSRRPSPPVTPEQALPATAASPSPRAVSPSELPPADPEPLRPTSKRAASAARTLASSQSVRLDLEPPGSHAVGGATGVSQKPAPSDPMDQQW